MINKKLEITRTKHLEHLGRVTPFIFAIYSFQCFLMNSILQENLTYWFITMAMCICGFLGLFYIYDLNQKITIHPNAIELKWSPFYAQKIIYYSEIVSVDASDIDQSFANIRIELRNKKSINLYFVDSPELVVHTINKFLIIPEENFVLKEAA